MGGSAAGALFFLSAAAGLAVVTLGEAEALSYLSEDPAACANCHIMYPERDAWQRASHAARASCADCHLPHAGLRKWMAKADSGWRHAVGFTLQNFAEPIRTTPESDAHLEENCRRCHAALLPSTPELGDSAHRSDGCLHCHAQVGHGPYLGLGGPVHD